MYDRGYRQREQRLCLSSRTQCWDHCRSFLSADRNPLSRTVGRYPHIRILHRLPVDVSGNLGWCQSVRSSEVFRFGKACEIEVYRVFHEKLGRTSATSRNSSQDSIVGIFTRLLDGISQKSKPVRLAMLCVHTCMVLKPTLHFLSPRLEKDALQC